MALFTQDMRVVKRIPAMLGFRKGRPGRAFEVPAVRRLAPGDGGKGDGLLLLRDLGLPIPPTWTVPVEHFHEQVGRGLDAPLLPANVRAWKAHCAGRRWVVRSSGLEEDGQERSFAGMHASVVGVEAADVPEAIRAVWRSAFSARATAYGRDGGGMVVLLQPLIEPEAAGVIFTMDPRTGSFRDLVVEAVHGQGEALVSGRQIPQRARIRRGFRLRIIERDDAEQPVRWTVRGGRLTPVAVEPPGRLLADRVLTRLASDALRAERRAGHPLDIEFAWDGRKLTYLQARPITALRPLPTDVLWTRRFIGERLPDPPTPMTWSILEPLFAHFIAYPDTHAQYLAGSPPMRRFRGYGYLNVSVFRHLVFKPPGRSPPSFMLELLPDDEAHALRTAHRRLPDLRVVAALLAETVRERRWERFAWDPRTNIRVWEAFQSRADAALTALEGPPETQVDLLLSLLREYLGIHLCSLLFANLGFQGVEHLLERWEASDLLPSLLLCPAGNQTLALNDALSELEDALGDRLPEALSADVPPPELQSFLDRYGDRSSASWELFSPRWREHPDQLLPLLGQVAVEPPDERDVQEALLHLRQRVGPVRAGVLEAWLVPTRMYLLLRENQRFAFERLTGALQRALVAWGEALGWSPDEVPWATLDELRAGRRPAAETRRADVEAGAFEPPTFLRGDVPADPPVGRRRVGVGFSPGRVTGRVRVLHSLAEGPSLQEGEILVAPALDPGWTPLLTRAAGVVLELGSQLSHGAIVAREYRVPGVANLEGATRSFQDGEVITVDGTRGEVWGMARPETCAP